MAQSKWKHLPSSPVTTRSLPSGCAPSSAALSLSQRLSRQALERGLESLEARRMLSVTTDEQGWTVFGRSADTRIVYVSNSTGSDTNSGLAEDAPVKTLAKARTLLRNGTPDWMLLKRGDVWTENFTNWKTSGRDEDEMMVIGAYGSGARPKLNTGTAGGFSNGTSPESNRTKPVRPSRTPEVCS